MDGSPVLAHLSWLTCLGEAEAVACLRITLPGAPP
jgi:hypothetical protein